MRRLGTDSPDRIARAFSRASARLADAVLRSATHADDGGDPRLADLTARIRAASRRPGVEPARELARRLAGYDAADSGDRTWLTDRLRHAARHLARGGTPPRRGAGCAAWRAVVIAARRLHDSAVRRLPTAAFLNPPQLAALIREGRRRRPRRPGNRTRYAAPGPALRRLAVERRLQAAASRALGFSVVPTYRAAYMYDPPRSHMVPHLDSAEFEVVVHLVLEHRGGRNADARSALVVHRPDRDVRLALAPGQAVVLAGRGAVHQWEPLAAAEHRTLVGIGFRRRRSR